MSRPAGGSSGSRRSNGSGPTSGPSDSSRAGSRPRSTDESFFLYCPRCATPLSRPGTDARPEPEADTGNALATGPFRPECPRCGFRQYRNPVVGVAGVVWEHSLEGVVDPASLERIRAESGGGAGRASRILLGRRAPSARFPGWCIPCGYVEYDEDIREALVREMEEETGIRVTTGRILAVHSNFHDPDRQSVGVWFLARPAGGSLRPGDDIDALGFFAPGDLRVPLAFPTDDLVITALRDAV